MSFLVYTNVWNISDICNCSCWQIVCSSYLKHDLIQTPCFTNRTEKSAHIVLPFLMTWKTKTTIYTFCRSSHLTMVHVLACNYVYKTSWWRSVSSMFFLLYTLWALNVMVYTTWYTYTDTTVLNVCRMSYHIFIIL